MNLDLYTTAELELMLMKHKEGRVTLPRKILQEVEREIKARSPQITRGDRVFDVADERHVGVVRNVVIRGGVRFVTIRWEETGWLSFLVPARDLRRAPVERTARHDFIEKFMNT